MFNYNNPTPDEIQVMNNFRADFKDLVSMIIDEVPPSRERSLAITKLEEASMWLNKAITHPQEND